MNIRPAQPRDRQRVREILVATDRFSGQEVGWAIDLVDAALAHPERGEYFAHVLEEAGLVHGYVLFGPTPMADGVYDLYWIAVDPNQQKRGFGRALLEFVENEVSARAGRMLLIETSSKRSYEPTRRFYERAGYHEISRIEDFYRIEDAKLVFCKRLEG